MRRRRPAHRRNAFVAEVMLTSTHSNIWLLDRVCEWVDHDLNTAAAAGDVELVTGTGPDDAVRSARAGASLRLKCDGHDFADRVITEEHAQWVLWSRCVISPSAKASGQRARGAPWGATR